MAELIDGVGQESLPSLTRRFSGFDFVGKEPEVVSGAVHLHLRCPLTSRLMPTHPPVLRGVAQRLRPVLVVGRERYDPKVCEPVVKTIPVQMVSLALVSARKTEQGAMKSDRLPDTLTDLEPDGVPLAIRMPSPLADPFRLVGIDDGVGHNIPPTVVEGNARCVAVIHWGREWQELPPVLIFYATGMGAEAASSALFVQRGKESCPALNASQRDGSLRRHHDLLSRYRGVRPRVVQPTSGLSRVNYTRLEAA
jgi:hypothetical protein